MLRRNAAISSFVLLNLVSWAGAAYYPGNTEPNFPGHSGVDDVTGSSGYGCQSRDNEVILSRDPKHSGDDDGTLWTGETVFEIHRHTIDDEDEAVGVSCNGTFRMPTLFWLGPYLQGANGKDNLLALGMITWRTNSTDKSDTWHVYRPCEFVPTDVPSENEFSLRGSVHYDNATAPPNDSTLGLRLVPPPPPIAGNETFPSSSPQIFFNGTFNGVKDTSDYISERRFSTVTDFHLNGLNCSRALNPERGEDSLTSAGAEIPPGTRVNGSLSNDTVSLRLAGSNSRTILWEDDDGNKGKIPTDVEFSITFNGRYDARNSSQSLLIDTTNEPIITFSSAVQWQPSISLLSEVLFLFCLYFML